MLTYDEINRLLYKLEKIIPVKFIFERQKKYL